MNPTYEELTYIEIDTDVRRDFQFISTKELQTLLKTCMKRTKEQDFIKQLDVKQFKNSCVMKLCQKCKTKKYLLLNGL
jgi:hypothetical protein